MTSHRSTILRFLLVGIITVIVALVSVQYTLKTSEDRSAFLRWKSQLHALGEGKDIYQLYLFPNAPMMALVLYPISLLPEISVGSLDLELGAHVWFYLKVCMTILAFFWTFKLVEDSGVPFPGWAKLATILLSIRPIVGDLSHGNVNLLILFLIVAALHAFRKGQDFWAGVILALAITCKVTPALFIPYFLWKRAWRTLSGCLIGLALFLFVVPSIFLGPVRNAELLQSWTDKMILPYMTGSEVTSEHINQSLNGVFHRLLSRSPAFDDRSEEETYYNFVAWDSATVRGLLKVGGVIFLALMCGTCRTPTQPRQSFRLAGEYSIVILGMLLFSERTWKHHCVVLLIPYAFLCYHLAVHCHDRLQRGILVGIAAAFLLLMTATSTTIWEVGGYRFGAKLAQTYGAYTWAFLILLGTITAILLRAKNRAAPPRRKNFFSFVRVNRQVTSKTTDLVT